MNQSFHTVAPTIWIGIVSIANVCLMVTAAFYPDRASTGDSDANWREKMGLAAVCFGLCSQVLYCLMLFALVHGWVPFYSGNSFNHLQLQLSNLGSLLSVVTFFCAAFGRGLRRYSGLWVGVSSGSFWGLSGLSAALGSLFGR